MQARARGREVALLAATLALGAASRIIHTGVWVWDKSLGDALYAVAIFFVLALIRSRAQILTIAALTFTVCAAIEFFQLTDIPLELSRHHRIFGILLGTTFAWHDLACYAIGTAAAALAIRWTIPRRSPPLRPPDPPP